MLDINHIDHINLSVSDLEKSLRFYQDLFGLEVKERGDYAGKPYAIAGLGGKLMLAMYQADSLSNKGRINHFGIHIGEFEKALKVLKENNVSTLYSDRADGTVVYPNSRSVYVADPDGNEIELSEKFGGGP